MKIIDNRYKIETIIKKTRYFESYKVIDLWNNNSIRYLKIYSSEVQDEIIEYHIDNFRFLSNIRHKSLLSCYQFSLIKSIDAKRINTLLYYSVTEYNNSSKLSSIVESLTLKERLCILLETIAIIDFLHFRGLTYVYLNPGDIFIHNNKEIKITNLSTIYERRVNNYYNDISTNFLSPEAINNMKNKEKEDYYSLGILIKYLFLEDYLVEDMDRARYKKELKMTKEQEKVVNMIVNKLVGKNGVLEKINLIDIIEEINQLFQVNYNHNITQSREVLHFQEKIVGREREIEKILSIDQEISRGSVKHRGILIKSDEGIGKTRLVNEISHHLKLKGREVYFVEVLGSKSKDLSYISNILRQSIIDAPTEVMFKYRYELSKILPELRISGLDSVNETKGEKTNIYRLYNRITNYFDELSKKRTIYILIDNLHYMNRNTLKLVDYLVRNIKSNNMFFIYSCDNKVNKLDQLIVEKTNQWIDDNLFIEMELYKLNLQEIGQILQNVLGISTIPMNFATVLFKEGQGNPRHIEYIIKELFARKELYINRRGKWSLKAKQYSDIKFPTDMQEALKKQLDTIKEQYFEIFKIMSIFNNVINRQTMLEMLEEDKNSEDTLEHLIEVGLVDEKLADWGYGYSISGLELKQLIYAEMDLREKIYLHDKAANILERYLNEDYNNIIEELLFHLIKSNQLTRALKIIFRQIKGIRNKYSTQMLFLLEQAYEILKKEPSEEKLEVLEKILEIYSLKNMSEKAGLYLEEYQREAEVLEDHKHIIYGKYLLTEKYFKTEDIDKALKESEEIEKIGIRNNIIEGEIIALIIRARFGFKFQGDKDLEKELNKALELSNSFGIERHRGNIYNLLGLNESLRGNTREAIENYEKSIFHYEKAGNSIEVSKPINNIANIYAEKYGDGKKAMEYYRRGLEIVRKFGFYESEIIFVNNIAETYINNYEFDKAQEYIERAQIISRQIGDTNMFFLSSVNMGLIQLYTGDYRGAYETYSYLQEINKKRKILDVEINIQYNNFLGEFYGLFGMWGKSIYHSEIVVNLCKNFKVQEYLNAEVRIFYSKYFQSQEFDKESAKNILERYRKTELVQARRSALLKISAISIFNNDIDYGRKLLEEDYKLKKIFKHELLEENRSMIIANLYPIEKSIKKMIDLEPELVTKNLYDMGTVWSRIIGHKLFENAFYEESIKYLLETLDKIYKSVLKIPDRELQISYIKSRQGDWIKKALTKSCQILFGKFIEYTLVKDMANKKMSAYFDASPLFKAIGNENLIKIIKMENYGEAIRIKNIEELIANLTGSFQYNLDLILKYIAKESFAQVGFILSYDENLKEYITKSSLEKGALHNINPNILKLAAHNEKGILVNNNSKDKMSQKYGSFLSGNIKAIICIPIFDFKDRVKFGNERRKNQFQHRELRGYVYLETDKVFNRFDLNQLGKITNLIYLININLVNSQLQLMATTDKLTGTCTRKHFELKFQQLLTDAKLNEGIFSIVLLDIDDFKNINDSYGHRKGDEVLRIFGKVLHSSIRNSDIVARYGGEEFIIFLKGANEKAAIIVAEKIRKKIEDLEISGIDYPVTISLGISLYPDHSQYKEDLIEKADQALYYAKEMGKNRAAIWNDEMSSTLNRTDKLAGILTGNMNEDNRNILALVDIIELIKKDISLDEKIFIWLGRILETTDANFATLILGGDSKGSEEIFTRTRFTDQWVQTPKLNNNIINRVLKNRKGEYLIDWDNTHNLDPLSGLPNWQSVIVFPVIKSEETKGIVYISVPMQEKEFDFNSFNISKKMGNIVAGIL